jgi:hypothetical protein
MIDTSQRLRVATALALLLVSLAYLVQIASPLRLIVDGVDYLLQASSAADGGGFRVHGLRSVRPPGYPALIFLLVKAGIGTSWAIVALNCLLLGIGCWASYGVLRRCFGFEAGAAQVICLLTLLSFVMVKHVTHPLSDICFFGVSMPCLLLLLQAEADKQLRRYWRLAVAALLMGFCIEVRTIGIALIPAFAWATLGGAVGASRTWQTMRHHRIASLVLMLPLLVAIAWAGRTLLHLRYLQANSTTIQQRGVFGNLAWDVRAHVKEWGELAVNAPSAKLPGGLGVPIQIAGFIVLLLWLTGLWEKRRNLDASLWYGVAYAAIVLAWPWSDARFWLPVLPLLMGYVLVGSQRVLPARLLRPAMVAYCSLFCLLGVIALGYSTRLTFAGKKFPDLYGDGTLRATYRLAFLGEPPKKAEEISPDAFYLLHRYQWHLARK